MSRLGVAVARPTCAHCGERDSTGVETIDGRNYRTCDACATAVPEPEIGDPAPASGAEAVAKVFDRLGSSTLGEVVRILGGDYLGNRTERAQYTRIRHTIHRMVAAGSLATVERRGQTAVYRLTGKPVYGRVTCPRTVELARVAPPPDRPAVNRAMAAARQMVGCFTAGMLAERAGLSKVRSVEIARVLAAEGVLVHVTRGRKGIGGAAVYELKVAT